MLCLLKGQTGMPTLDYSFDRYLGSGARLMILPSWCLTADDRWRIAVQAAVRTNEKYGLVSIASLFAYSFVGLWTRRRGFSVAQAKSVHCCHEGQSISNLLDSTEFCHLGPSQYPADLPPGTAATAESMLFTRACSH
jgi:hypothetical protein